ncbi:MAG: radical SAM protein [Patescibacteria group bacterium]
MKMVFVQNFLGPHFGIMYISAVLKQNGYSTDVFIEGLHKDIVKDICDAKPDIIGFTCITGEHRWLEKRAAEIKKYLDVPIIVGGPHPTYFPEMVEIDNVDIVCRGDGENVVLELMNRKTNKQEINDIQGLWVKKDGKIYRNNLAPLVENIEKLPLPDRDIYDKYEFFRTETEIPVCLSRGCPFSCTFCYNAAKKKLYLGQKVVRLRSVDNIIAEIKSLFPKYPRLKSIIFNDDNLGLNLEWFNEFCWEYNRINGPPFFASIRADFINEERIEKLKKANCFCLSIGVETGNAEMRGRILQKKISDATYLRAAQLIRKNGIRLRTSNMVFLPGETIKDAFNTLELNKKMKVQYPWVYPLQPYPGTEIYDYAIGHGFLDKNFSFDDIDPLGLLESPLMLNLKDGRKIKVLHRLFYYGVKVPGFIHLLKLLIFIPNNFIFDFFHRLAILTSYASYHQINIFRALKISLQAYRLEKEKN